MRIFKWISKRANINNTESPQESVVENELVNPLSLDTSHKVKVTIATNKPRIKFGSYSKRK